jgi:hypothetical protein
VHEHHSGRVRRSIHLFPPCGSLTSYRGDG